MQSGALGGSAGATVGVGGGCVVVGSGGFSVVDGAGGAFDVVGSESLVVVGPESPVPVLVGLEPPPVVSSGAENDGREDVEDGGASGGGVSGAAGVLCRAQAPPEVLAVLLAVLLAVAVPAVLVADAVPTLNEPVPDPVRVSSSAEKDGREDVEVGGASLGGVSGAGGMLCSEQTAAVLDAVPLEADLVLD